MRNRRKQTKRPVSVAPRDNEVVRILDSLGVDASAVLLNKPPSHHPISALYMKACFVRAHKHPDMFTSVGIVRFTHIALERPTKYSYFFAMKIRKNKDDDGNKHYLRQRNMYIVTLENISTHVEEELRIYFLPLAGPIDDLFSSAPSHTHIFGRTPPQGKANALSGLRRSKHRATYVELDIYELYWLLQLDTLALIKQGRHRGVVWPPLVPHQTREYAGLDEETLLWCEKQLDQEAFKDLSEAPRRTQRKTSSAVSTRKRTEKSQALDSSTPSKKACIPGSPSIADLGMFSRSPTDTNVMSPVAPPESYPGYCDLPGYRHVISLGCSVPEALPAHSETVAPTFFEPAPPINSGPESVDPDSESAQAWLRVLVEGPR